MKTEIKKQPIGRAETMEQIKETYVKPAIEVIEIEIEGAILTGSSTGNDWGNGGYYER